MIEFMRLKCRKNFTTEHNYEVIVEDWGDRKGRAMY